MLRVLSLMLGDRLIPMLKARLIFKAQRSPYGFERRIVLEDRRIVVTDRITGLPAGTRVLPAPRSSKRHVSSADSYHREDLRLAEGVECRRTRNMVQGVFTAEASYDFT